MEAFGDILVQEYFGNTVQAWLMAAAVFLGTMVGVWILKHFILSRLRRLISKSSTKMDNVVFGVIDRVGFGFFAAVALFASVQHLALPSVVLLVVRGVFYVMMIHEVIKVLEKVLLFAASVHMRKTGEEKKMSVALGLIIKIVLWSIGALLVLSNLGFNINSLVASLGIGGLAVSLALQNVLSDIFSSFSIAFDKPFEEGDYIVVGEHDGTVKHIGLKTTRIEALQGEEIIISNQELTTARVQNFRRMNERRVETHVGVTYDTKPETLREIPEIVRSIIESVEHASFGRAHFESFGDSSLSFEIIYFVDTREYAVYMDAQHEINVKMHEEFGKRDIEMAFPTRTVHVVKEG